MQKRFCDWCEEPVTEAVGDYVIVTIQQSYQSGEHKLELCNNCGWNKTGLRDMVTKVIAREGKL